MKNASETPLSIAPAVPNEDGQITMVPIRSRLKFPKSSETAPGRPGSTKPMRSQVRTITGETRIRSDAAEQHAGRKVSATVFEGPSLR
jgi:hypothetical protein